MEHPDGREVPGLTASGEPPTERGQVSSHVLLPDRAGSAHPRLPQGLEVLDQVPRVGLDRPRREAPLGPQIGDEGVENMARAGWAQRSSARPR